MVYFSSATDQNPQLGDTPPFELDIDRCINKKPYTVCALVYYVRAWCLGKYQSSYFKLNAVLLSRTSWFLTTDTFCERTQVSLSFPTPLRPKGMFESKGRVTYVEGLGEVCNESRWKQSCFNAWHPEGRMCVDECRRISVGEVM